MSDDKTKEPVEPEKNPLYTLVLGDVRDRSKWAKRDAEIVKRRLGDRKVRTKPYKGAPNAVDPIVDDTVREKTDQEVSMLRNAPRLAIFIALDSATTPETTRQAELAFDTYLRHMVHFTTKLETALDMKNARGFSTFFEHREESEEWGMIPTVSIPDLRDLILPGNATNPRTAERMTRVVRFHPRLFESTAKERRWRHWERYKAGAPATRGESGSEERSTADETAELVGITTSAKTEDADVVVWECYHYATAWDAKQDPTGRVIEGRRCVSTFRPNDPDFPLAVRPWREPDQTDTATGKATPGADRTWPAVQSRYENRAEAYYDSRGIGQLCMDEQIAASRMLNSKLILMDYYQQPLLKGQTRNSSNVTLEPGSSIPEGLDFATMPQIPQQIDFDIDMHRRRAGTRAGAGSQYQFSGEAGRTRKLQKTATEVQAESNRTGMVSSASVDRFNEPLIYLFNDLWRDLARLKKPLPMIAEDTYMGTAAPEEIYGARFLIVPAASAKTLNPDDQFIKGQNALAFIAQFKDSVSIDVEEALVDIMSYWDPVRARRWIQRAKQGQGKLPPLYQVVQGLQQQLTGLSQATEGIVEQLDEHDKVLTNVAKIVKALPPKPEAAAQRGGGDYAKA